MFFSFNSPSIVGGTVVKKYKYQEKFEDAKEVIKTDMKVFNDDLVWFGLVWFMVFNATFNNNSVISWWLVLLVEKTVVPGENYRPVASY